MMKFVAKEKIPATTSNFLYLFSLLKIRYNDQGHRVMFSKFVLPQLEWPK